MLQKRNTLKVLALNELKQTFGENFLFFHTIFFTTIALYIFRVVFSGDFLLRVESLYGTMLVITLFATASVEQFSLVSSYRNGLLEQIFLLPPHPLYYLIIKLACVYLRQALLLTLLWGCIWIIFGLKSEFFSLTVLANYLIFVFILLLFLYFINCISLAIDIKQTVIFQLLSLFFIFPYVIFSTLALGNYLYLLLMVALLLATLPLTILFIYMSTQESVSM